MNKSKNSFDLIALIIAALILILFGFAYPTIPYNNGLGTDGLIYASLAKDLPGQIARGVWTYSQDYYFQRLLPPALIWSTFRIFHIEPSDVNIILGFRVMNSGFLVLAAFLWWNLARLWSLCRKSLYFGFVCIFVCVGNTLIPFYYPTLTDIVASVLSLGILNLATRNNRVGLLALSVLGGFIWPIILPLGLLVFLFPQELALTKIPTTTKKIFFERLQNIFSVGIPFALASLPVLIIIGISRSATYNPKYGLAWVGMDFSDMRAIIGIPLIFLWALYLEKSLLVRKFFDLEIYVNWLKDRQHIIFVLVALFIYLILKKVVGIFVPSTNSNLIAFAKISSSTLIAPFTFLANHVIYYGPVIVFIYIFWKEIVSKIHSCGLGITLFVAANVLFSFDTESRHLQLVVPVLIAFTVKVIQEKNFNNYFYGIWIAVSVCMSQFWSAIPTELFHSLAFPMPYDPRYIVLTILFIILALLTTRLSFFREKLIT